ncbi:hypothetical protein TWF730_009694 [Orbilia blumenaviensis]|uniref:F-box domain-containing protein n=1 Tax=Orbilia blumenaviensis TaxID=1796055 RepID=A0AAV9UW04_9PEZI
MVVSGFESLPYDVFLHILCEIDEKADLDSLRLAFPDSVPSFLQAHPKILDRAYWNEIERDYLLPLALLNFRFHRSHEAARILECLNPPKLQLGMSVAWVLNGDEDPSKKANSIRRATIESLNADTVSQMRTIHEDIERLANIFTDHQLKPHYSSRSYRPPTTSERLRVMKAIYNTWMVMLSKITRREFELGHLTDLYLPDISGVEHRDVKIYSDLNNAWGFWDAREVEVVMELLWEEIPRRVAEEGFGEQPLKSKPRRIIGRDTWFLQDETAEIYIREHIDLIDFIYTEKEFSPGKQAELLESLGNGKKAREAIDTLVRSDKCAKSVFHQDGAQRGEISVIFRTGMLRNCREAVRNLLYMGLRRCALGKDMDTYRAPPLRRLVKGIDGAVEVPQRYRGLIEKNWTLSDNVMVADCMWDDGRLQELGYQTPRFIEPLDRYSRR